MQPKRTFVTAMNWDGPTWLKWFQTININLTCVALGLIVSLMGPTLIDLSEIFHTSIQKAANIGMAADVGSIIGPFFADQIYCSTNAQLVCIISGILIGVSTFLIPLGNLMSSYVANFICGMLGAILEIGAYVWLVGLWNGSRPILQLYSLMFGVGGLFAPLIAKPFLSKDRDLLANNTEWDSELEWETDSQVVVPFALIGAFSIMVALSMAVSYLRDKRDVRPEKKGENTGFQFRDWLLTALVATYHFLIVLSETSFNRFLVIYAVQVNHIPKAEAAVLVSIFWMGFTAVRVIIIPISAKFSSIWIVASGQILFNIACLTLLLFSHNTRVLYAGTIMFGCGMAPLYGGSLTWLTEHISLRHVYLSLILILTCAGSMAAPPIVSPWIETYPKVLPITVTVGSFVMLIVLFLMVIAARVTKEEEPTSTESIKKIESTVSSVVNGRNQMKTGVDNFAVHINDEVSGFCSRM